MLEKPENGGRLQDYLLTLVNEPLPTQFPRLPEHKNADFVLEIPENGGSRGQKRTKMPILCSKCSKTRVPKAKSAQKSRFCARKPRKRGFQRVKAHKKPDFVLGKPENEGLEGQKRTKTLILCSKCPKTRVPKAKKAQKCRFCARKEGKVASGSLIAQTLIVNVAFLQITAHTFKT